MLGAYQFEVLLAETVELLVDGVDDLDGDDRALRHAVHSVPFSRVNYVP